VNALCNRWGIRQQGAHFFNCPNMIANSSFHCGRYAQRRMHSAEVVVYKPNRYCGGMVLNLLSESICQPSESPNAHPYRKILPINKARADVLWIWIAAHNFHIAADALGRRIPRLILIHSAINLLQLCVVNISTESILDCL